VVKESCPKGVDVFFDNTGGPIHDAVIKNLNIGARVIICGRIALAAQFGKPDIGERFMGQLIVSRASIHGFWYSIGGTGEMKRSDISQTGTVQDKFVSKRMYSTGSNECQKRFCDCCMAGISVSRS
jgi:NADPH:quinone reductase-like Zn-dependent oxidoreductase